MDRLTSMTTFVEVVHSGSFTGAAQRLELSRGVVTTHVQGLERRLGIRLLNRTTRKVSLTEEGDAFYRRCCQILADLAEAESIALSRQSTPRGTLRLNTDVALAPLMAPLVAEYVTIYPEVSFEVIVTDRIVDMLEWQFDLAIHAGPLPDSSLIRRHLGVERRVLCASPALLACCGSPQQPADLIRFNCLSMANSPVDDRWQFVGAEGKQEVSVTGHLRSNSLEALRAAALSGQGVCLLPLPSVASELVSGRLIRLLPAYEIPDAAIQAIYPAGRHVSIKVRTFVDLAVRRLRHIGVDQTMLNAEA
ncbi:MAG TPA: LysR family transcriptional regulator, partial [Xanthobacteraceae bacterium]|nr:LysR family transcriptional regulator [Xanthobacteraceae bacterium]